MSKTKMMPEKQPVSEEMARFNAALKKVVRVSKSRLDYLLEVDRVTPLVPQKRGRKPKVSAPVSRERD